MKRIAVLTILVLFTVISCNLGLIQEIEVKGDPEYQIPLGKTAALVLSDHFDVEKLLDENEDLEFDIIVETVTENGITFTQLLVEQEIFNVNFDEIGDFEEFLDIGDLDLGDFDEFDFGDLTIDEINDVIAIDVDFSEFADFTDIFNLDGLDFGDIAFDDIGIPEIDEEIVLDIDLNILDFFSFDFPVAQVEINILSEPGDDNTVEIPDAEISITIDNEEGFTFITFSEGILELDLSLDVTDTGLIVTITEAYITDDPDDVTSSINIPADLSGGNLVLTGGGTEKLEFDLNNNKKLSNEFYIVFTAVAQDGVLGQVNKILVTPSLKEEVIYSVEGLTLDESESPVSPIEFPSVFPDELVSAVVATGSIVITLDIPDSWENIELTGTTFTLTDTGAINNIESTTSDDITYTIDLAGLDIQEDMELKFDYNIVIKTTNGKKSTITTDQLDITSTIEITEFATLTVNMPDLDVVQNFSFEADFLEFVTGISFAGDPPQLSFVIDNDLPFDLELTISSSELIGDTDAVLVFPKGLTTTQDALLQKNVDLSGLGPDGDGNIELLTITAKPSGYSENKFEMTDVVVGYSYGLDIESVSIADIETVTLDLEESDALDISFPADQIPDELLSAVIGDGSISITVSLPAGWDPSYIDGTSFVLTHGETPFHATGPVVDNENNTVTYTIDLSGLEITGEGAELGFAYTFVIDGEIPAATIDDLDISAAVNIKEFSTLIVELDLGELGIDESFDVKIGAAFLDYVQVITFKDDEPKLSFTINNQLPFDLVFTIESDVLLKGGEAVITFPKGEKSTGSADLKKEVDFTSLSADENNEVTLMSIQIMPEGYADGELTLQDVTLGDIYSITVESVAIGDIDSVTLLVDFSDEIENAIDFSFLSDILPDGVSLKGVVAQMDFEGVEAFSGTIVLIAKYETDEGEVIRALLGTFEEGDEFNPENYVGEEFSPTNPAVINLDAIINDRAGNLSFAYGIKVEGFEVFLDDIPENLGVILNLTVPLHFVVDDDGVLLDLDDDGGDLLKLEEDLLGRDSADDDMNDLLNQVGSVIVHFDLLNNIGIRPEIRISGFNGDDKVLPFITGDQELELDSADIAHMIDTYPFQPKMYLWLQEGDHWINLDGDLEIGAWIQIGFDINYTIPLFEK